MKSSDLNNAQHGMELGAGSSPSPISAAPAAPSGASSSVKQIKKQDLSSLFREYADPQQSVMQGLISEVYKSPAGKQLITTANLGWLRSSLSNISLAKPISLFYSKEQQLRKHMLSSEKKRGFLLSGFASKQKMESYLNALVERATKEALISLGVELNELRLAGINVLTVEEGLFLFMRQFDKQLAGLVSTYNLSMGSIQSNPSTFNMLLVSAGRTQLPPDLEKLAAKVFQSTAGTVMDNLLRYSSYRYLSNVSDPSISSVAIYKHISSSLANTRIVLSEEGLFKKSTALEVRHFTNTALPISTVGSFFTGGVTYNPATQMFLFNDQSFESSLLGKFLISDFANLLDDIFKNLERIRAAEATDVQFYDGVDGEYQQESKAAVEKAKREITAQAEKAYVKSRLKEFTDKWMYSGLCVIGVFVFLFALYKTFQYFAGKKLAADLASGAAQGSIFGKSLFELCKGVGEFWSGGGKMLTAGSNIFDALAEAIRTKSTNPDVVSSMQTVKKILIPKDEVVKEAFTRISKILSNTPVKS